MATPQMVPREVVIPTLAPLPPQNLPETDEQPLESPWHRACINLLIESVEVRLAGRRDFYVGGNMFIYFSERQVRHRDYSGPDFFFVQGEGVDHDRPRKYWAIWNEGGRYPDVIIELLSESTAETDRTTKKDLYERTFRTPEYFLYDPETQALAGWRLNKRHRYTRIRPNEHGRLWSEQLGLWAGTWSGPYLERDAVWLRFFDEDGRVVPLRSELERQRAEAAEAELNRLRKEMARRRKS